MKETFKLYGGRVVVVFEKERHRYTVTVDNVPAAYVPSVTAITGMLDDGKSNALVGWALKLGAEALRAKLAKMLGTRQPIDEIVIEQLVDAVKTASKKSVEKAATIGTKVHEWVEQAINAEIEKKKTPPLPVNKQVKHGAEAFLEWRSQQAKLKFIAAEQKIYSLEHHFVGTYDALAKVGKDLVLVDLKTSNYMRPEYWLQTSGYALALGEEYESSIVDRIVLKVGKDEPTFEVHSAQEKKRDDAADTETFLALRRAYRWAKKA